MNLLSSDQVKRADQFTIDAEPISSLDLMERAGQRIADHVLRIFSSSRRYILFSGPGNNGGDGLVMARLLHQKGNEVVVYVLKVREYSNELKENIQRANDLGIPLHEIEKEDGIQRIDLKKDDVIIDALFGVGLNKPIEGLVAKLITFLNRQEQFKIAIDIPSGLSAYGNH